MMDIHKVIGKILFEPMFYQSTAIVDPIKPLQLDPQDNPLRGNGPYNAVDAIFMRHEICYRGNEHMNVTVK